MALDATPPDGCIAAALAAGRLLAGVAMAVGRVGPSARRGARDAPQALAVVLAATVGGLIVAPRLAAERPIVDVQAPATKLQSHAGVSFTWEPRYGPLKWPRDGHEVLRVRAKLASYWKAE